MTLCSPVDNNELFGEPAVSIFREEDSSVSEGHATSIYEIEERDINISDDLLLPSSEQKSRY
jgi:hypothetical protein